MRPTGYFLFSLQSFPALSLRSNAGFEGTAPVDKSKIKNQKSKIASGFTLLEVLLAMSLVMLLSAGVYAFYGYTLEAREQIAAEARTVFAQRRIMDLLAGELQSARADLEGAGDKISFMRAAVPGRAVFLAPNITRMPSIAAEKSAESPFEPQHDIQLVTYRLNDEVGGLERTCLKDVTVEVIEEGEDIEVVLLTEHVKFIHLQYWDGTGWSDSWSGDNLPQAVRIRLGAEALPEGVTAEEYPYETTCRVVAIPAGLYQKREQDQ